MDHFTIFQDFYRVIAEMTEEEIVSAISNGTYRETVEDVRRIFAEQGEKAANEKKIELPEITFSANYRGGRSNATLVKYLGYIVVDIDHQTQILRRWIVYNLPLLQELEQEGYRARNRLLSPRQVATIIRYLGEP